MKQGQAQNYVGRVGALALLLGVGAVLSPVPLTAAADAGSPDTNATSGAGDSARPTPARQTRGGRAGSGDGASAPTGDKTGAKSPFSAASVAASRLSRAKVTAVVPSAAATRRLEVPALREIIESRTASVDSASSVSVVDAPSVVVEAPSAAAAPALTSAAPRGALASAAADALSWLGGGRDPLAPIAAPLGWAVLAVSRRELAGVSPVSVPVASVAASEPVPSPLTDALAQPGATTALVAAAKQFVLTVVGGGDTATALQAGIRSLENDPAFSDISLQALLTDRNLSQAVGSTTATVITALAADPQVRAAVGAAIQDSLPSVLGDLPAGVAPAIANAAVALLADPGAGAALGSVAGTMVTVFLAQPGVIAGLGTVAVQLQGALEGQDFSTALDTAWEALQTVSAVRGGVIAAVTAGVNTALTDPRLVGALSTAASSLVGGLVADPSTWSMIGDLLDPTYASVVEDLLSDPATAAQLASTAGAVVGTFLGQPGVVAALSGIGGQVAATLWSGGSVDDATNALLDSLQSDPALLAAVSSTLAVAVQGILDNSAVKDAFSAVAERAVVELLTGSTDTSNLSPVAGRVVGAVVDSLLESDAVQSLIGDLAPVLVDASALEDVTATLIQTVIDDRDLQKAVGMAVGAAVGSLLGDNPIGNLVGKAVGRAATFVIRIVVNFAPQLLGVALPGSAAAENRQGSSYLFAVASV